MNPFFAVATNSDVITWGVILTITTIAANFAVIVGTRRKQKREVSFSEETASKRELDQHAAECKADRALLWTELNKDRHDNQTHASERSKTIYAKIENVRVELTEKYEALNNEMQRNFKDTERALGRIEGKLDEKIK